MIQLDVMQPNFDKIKKEWKENNLFEKVMMIIWYVIGVFIVMSLIATILFIIRNILV